VPGLDFAVGPRRLARLPAVLDLVAHGHPPVVETEGEALDAEAAGSLDEHLPGDVAAFVNILYGCDRGCTYCVVPAVRGHEYSRPAAEVVAEIGRLAAAGVKEVTLLGQSVMSYGRAGEVWPAGAPPSPRGFREPLPRLLEAAGAVPGIRRLRFTSGHPSGCTEELARAMAELEPVCAHLHLPLQSGSNRILDRMRRGYSRDEYRRAVDRIRARVPGLAVTTDIIVGFPSETAAEFEETSRFMDEIDFDNAFIFKYSPRPGTPAEAWDDDVPAEEKLRRNKVLLAEQDRRAGAHNAALVGATVEVLAEGVSLRSAERWTGRTRTNKIVAFEPEGQIRAGDIVSVDIARATAQTLYGALRR
jgi:tRNA-2-methylthio-N6-dimethylallyladenosine synthase